MTFTVPIKTRSGDNAREHHYTKARRMGEVRDAVAIYWLSATRARIPNGPPALPVTVCMTRLSPGVMDFDGLVSAMKPVRDEVAVQLGLPVRKLAKGQSRPVADDRDPRVTWEYLQEKCKRGSFGVRVDIQPRGT